MDGNFPSNENNNNKEIQDLKNEPTRNKLQLRKRNIHEVLDKKKVLLKDAEVDDKILNEIANSNYSKQIEDLKKLLTSTNEQNIIKALKFINNVVCILIQMKLFFLFLVLYWKFFVHNISNFQRNLLMMKESN